MDASSKISKNFTLFELYKSDTADRHKINNSPLILAPGDREVVLGNLQRVCLDVLEPIRERFGPFSPNSVFRCCALNEVVGGSKTSVHMLGLAADCEVPGVSNHDLLAWCRDNIKSADQILAEFLIFPTYKGATKFEIETGGWVHVGLAQVGSKPRGMYLEIGCKK